MADAAVARVGLEKGASDGFAVDGSSWHRFNRTIDYAILQRGLSIGTACFGLERTMRSPTSRLLSSRLAIISLIVAAFLGLCALLPVGAQNYAYADGEDPIAIWSDLNNDASTSDEGTVELALSYHPEIGQWLAVITNLSDNPLPASALYVLEYNSNSWMTASFDGVSSFESLEGTINESDSTSSFEHASAQLYRTPINLSDATVALAAGEEPVDTADVKVAMIVGDRKESAAGRLATWNNIAQTGGCSHSTVKGPFE